MLNALRHHRFGQRRGLHEVLSLYYVLNALRHHRFGQYLPYRYLNKKVKKVLNALRHHRFGQLHGIHASNTPRRCSTPCGITGLGRRLPRYRQTIAFCAQRLAASQVWAEATSQQPAIALTCAQRLAASQVWAETLEVKFVAFVVVLNALRHHRFGQVIKS